MSERGCSSRSYYDNFDNYDSRFNFFEDVLLWRFVWFILDSYLKWKWKWNSVQICFRSCYDNMIVSDTEDNNSDNNSEVVTDDNCSVDQVVWLYHITSFMPGFL